MLTGPKFIVVTGAGGFIGRALCARLSEERRPHRRIVRTLAEHAPAASTIALGDLANVADAALAATLDGAFAVVHLAARVHTLHETQRAAADAFNLANVVVTERLAVAALRAGVKRLILASTVKVHGDSSKAGHPICADDPPAPEDAYARSKLDGERALMSVCKTSTMTPIILRLPLTYGPGVKGNFLAMMDAIARRKALPLGAIHNRRHLLYVGNLVHAIIRLIDLPEAATGTWMIADNEALSTPELVRRIGDALNVRPRMFSVPVGVLRAGAVLAGRASLIPRLVESLEVDASPLAQMIGALPFSVDRGLAVTAAWWRAQHAI